MASVQNTMIPSLTVKGWLCLRAGILQREWKIRCPQELNNPPIHPEPQIKYVDMLDRFTHVSWIDICVYQTVAVTQAIVLSLSDLTIISKLHVQPKIYFSMYFNCCSRQSSILAALEDRGTAGGEVVHRTSAGAKMCNFEMLFAGGCEGPTQGGQECVYVVQTLGAWAPGPGCCSSNPSSATYWLCVHFLSSPISVFP